MDYRAQAYALIERGISVVPLTADGSKLPAMKWRRLQGEFLTPDEIEKECSNCGGLAAITGNISKLVCFDFDLNKQVEGQDYWSAFMNKVPEDLKRRMLVNQTRSGGYHSWMRTDYIDKTRKLTHRALTIDELYARYQKKIDDGFDKYLVSTTLLNNPRECIIETRYEGSYGVMSHADYKRIYGTEIGWVSKEEIQLLYDIAYELDFGFKKKSEFRGEVGDYKVMIQFIEDTSPSDTADMMISTGGYEFAGVEHGTNNILLKRVGSNNAYSAKVFADTGVIHEYGVSNIFTDGNQSHNSFDLLCMIHGFDRDEGINFLKQQK